MHENYLFINIRGDKITGEYETSNGNSGLFEVGVKDINLAIKMYLVDVPKGENYLIRFCPVDGYESLELVSKKK